MVSYYGLRRLIAVNTVDTVRRDEIFSHLLDLGEIVMKREVKGNVSRMSRVLAVVIALCMVLPVGAVFKSRRKSLFYLRFMR